jgi:osmoprotectant transport system permease protein
MITDSSFIQFIIMQWPSLLEKTWQQIYLVALATFFAILVGIPFAILAHYYKRLRTIILSITNIVQTIPSLALLAFLLPIFGIGAKPAIIAMALYGLLPIVRATLTGIESVSPQLLEAATAMGLTSFQTLSLLELPLAVPNIISGIKTSAVISVGVATLAAFIGAGGLGDFIMRGLAIDNTKLILLGAIPAALLALIIDGLIGFFSSLMNKRQYAHHDKKARYKLWITLVILFALIGTILFRCTTTIHARKNTVVVASKNFTESMILAELIATTIEDNSDIKVDRKLNLGSTIICQRAMKNKHIDIYPEYTGTAYLIVLHQSYHSGYSKQEIYDFVKKAYQQQFDIVWLAPFGFNNSEGLAVTNEVAKRYHLQKISDLKPVENHFTFAAPSENLQRADGIPGLRQVYGLKIDNIKEMDMSLLYDAAYHGQVDISTVFTTDGRIPKYHLKVLMDDKRVFPPYYAAPIVRAAILRKYPQLTTLLAPLAGILDETTMQRLNAQVDIEHQTPHQVAVAFLQQKGLID